MDMGAKIRDTQVLFDDNMLKTVSKNKYNYKTDIPEFVDSIAISKIREVIESLQWEYSNIFYINGEKYELRKWNTDDGVEVEINDRILKVNKKYFRELYENRDK